MAAAAAEEDVLPPLSPKIFLWWYGLRVKVRVTVRVRVRVRVKG